MNKYLIYGSILLLVVLHHDFWWWHDKTLLFDFVPIGLASQMAISILASILWTLAVFFAWPEEEIIESMEVEE